MYAVIETGGKQYRVELGSELAIERLDGAPGDTINFERVLLVADGDAAQIGTPLVADAQVTASVLRQDRGEKLIVFKYRPKARHRSKNGHRQEQTVIRVADIRFNGRSAADEANAQQKEESKARQKSAAEAEVKASADAALASKLDKEAAERDAVTAAAAKPAPAKKTTAAAKKATTTAKPAADKKASAATKPAPAKKATTPAKKATTPAKKTTAAAKKATTTAAKPAAESKPKTTRKTSKKDE